MHKGLMFQQSKAEHIKRKITDNNQSFGFSIIIITNTGTLPWKTCLKWMSVTYYYLIWSFGYYQWDDSDFSLLFLSAWCVSGTALCVHHTSLRQALKFCAETSPFRQQSVYPNSFIYTFRLWWLQKQLRLIKGQKVKCVEIADWLMLT